MEENEPKVPERKVVYKDKETGKILYGYSQKNLDKIYKLGWALVILLALGLLVFGGLTIYGLYKIERWEIVGKFLQAIRDISACP